MNRTVTHHGATLAVPRFRNSMQAMPLRPTNPHGDTFGLATAETLRERQVSISVSPRAARRASEAS